MHENKNQRRDKNGLTGLEGGKPCKNLGRKRQKNLCVALPSRREREKVEKVLKKKVESVKKTVFKKTGFTIFD